MGCRVVVRDLYKLYPGGYEALRGLNLVIEENELAVILGPNGAGKTTLLRSIAGSLRPSRGDVIVCGASVRADPIRVRSLVGFVAEHSMLFPELSVIDNIVFSARVHGMSKKDAITSARELLESLGLWDIRDKKYGHLSKGLKRRADIAAALIHDPEVLVLDEPSSGLDPVSALMLRNSIRALHEKGKTVIIATHNVAEAMDLATRVYVLNRGRLGIQGEPRELREKLGARETVFLVEVEGDIEHVARILARNGLSVAITSDNMLRIMGTSSQIIRSLAMAEAELGARIRRIAVKELTWEELFARLVQSISDTRACRCPLGCT